MACILAICDCEAEIPVGVDGLSYLRDADDEVVNSRQHVALPKRNGQ